MKRSATAGLMIVVFLAACGDDPPRTVTPPPSAAPLAVTPQAAVPVVADVVCGKAATRVSTTRVAAQRDGIHVRVRDESGKPDTYLHYGTAEGPGGGDAVEGERVFVLGMPPGKLTLRCSHNSADDPQVTVEVLDPSRAWLSGALATHGCKGLKSSIVDWVYKESVGATPEAATAVLSAQIDKPTTWKHAQEGYVDAAKQSYVVFRGSLPWVVGEVTQQPDGSYSAWLGSYC